MKREFLEEHRAAMMKILLTYYQTYITSGCELNVCDEIVNETNDYLTQSDELSEVLETLIKKTNGINDKVDVRELYAQLPDKLRKEMTCRLLCEKLKKSIVYGNSYNRGDKNKNILAHLTQYKLITGICLEDGIDCDINKLMMQ